MNKKVVIIVSLIVIAIAAGAGGYFGWRKLRTKPTKPDQSGIAQASEQEPEKVEVAKRPGEYTVYDPAKFTQATDGKVVLFFNAKWSKTSKMLDADFKANVAKIPNNLTILSVDYDKNFVLRKQYQVPFENTFVQVDASGAMVNRWSGSETLDEIVALAR